MNYYVCGEFKIVDSETENEWFRKFENITSNKILFAEGDTGIMGQNYG